MEYEPSNLNYKDESMGEWSVTVMAEWSRQEDSHDHVMERKERVDLLLDRPHCHQLLQCESRSPQCASAVPPATIKVYKKTKIQLQTGAFTQASLKILQEIMPLEYLNSGILLLAFGHDRWTCSQSRSWAVFYRPNSSNKSATLI